MLNKERSVNGELQQRLQVALAAWDVLAAARVPFVTELAKFLQEDLPKLLKVPAETHCRAKVPLFALEWLPGTRPDLAIAWPNLTPSGTFGLLGRLCLGELRPEDAE